MLYLIGLGLNLKGMSTEGKEILARCKKVYLEGYTVNFPYKMGPLMEFLGKKVEIADREKVENLEIVDEAAKKDVALLIYGSPLTATTHISLIQEAKRVGVKYKIIYSGSVFDAIAETGLQFYKFGKVASMPTWQKSFTPDSFMGIVKQNQSMLAHSLILMDIGLDFSAALDQLEIAAKNHEIKLDKLVVCQSLGTSHAKIFYKNIHELKEFTKVRKPYCIILPSKLHFVEKEFLEEISR